MGRSRVELPAVGPCLHPRLNSLGSGQGYLCGWARLLLVAPRNRGDIIALGSALFEGTLEQGLSRGGCWGWVRETEKVGGTRLLLQEKELFQPRGPPAVPLPHLPSADIPLGYLLAACNISLLGGSSTIAGDTQT